MLSRKQYHMVKWRRDNH